MTTTDQCPPMDPIHQKELALLERTLSQHIDTTNSKLDKLIELTRQMASVQERQSRHSDDIRRLEKSQSDMAERILTNSERFDAKLAGISLEHKQVVQRIFDRIDTALSHQETTYNRLQDDFDDGLEDLETKVDALRGQLTALSEDYNTRIGFTRGALFILGGVLALAQALVYAYFSSLHDELKELRDAQSTYESRSLEDQQQLQLLQQQIQQMTRIKRP